MSKTSESIHYDFIIYLTKVPQVGWGNRIIQIQERKTNQNSDVFVRPINGEPT